MEIAVVIVAWLMAFGGLILIVRGFAEMMDDDERD